MLKIGKALGKNLNLLYLAIVLLFSCTSSPEAHSQKVVVNQNVKEVGISVSQTSLHELALNPAGAFSSVDEKVRSAAVRVRTESGHGSGTYMEFRGFNVIFTASHIASVLGHKHIIEGVNEEVNAKVIYTDPIIDVAVLLLDYKMSTRTPMKYRPVKNISKIGKRIVYSGYPGDHSLLAIKGMVAGYEEYENNTFILLHSYGWFGCSGSGVYDERGRFVGVLWGIDVTQSPYGVQLIEDIIWVTPASAINEERIINGICRTEIETQECKRYFIKRMQGD